MTPEAQRRLFKRHPGNPILTANAWPYPVNTVFNPGAARLPDGRVALLCRVEGRSGHSHLSLAVSENGIDGWQVSPEPTLRPDVGTYPEELWGIEDPRITWLEEPGKYAVTHTSHSQSGPCVSLTLSEDLRRYEKLGVVLPADNKDAAVLPRKIDGRWAMMHRPATPNGGNIWIAYSEDLKYWGDHRMIMSMRRGGWWDSERVGLAGPPIETKEGWLAIYHGTRPTAAGSKYRLGLALFDLENPEKLLLRGADWFMTPEEPYELSGDVGGVVFPCGHIVGEDSDTLHLYYGAADSCIALATGKISEMLDWLHETGYRAD